MGGRWNGVEFGVGTDFEHKNTMLRLVHWKELSGAIMKEGESWGAVRLVSNLSL